jgi:hypothetical protein
VREELMLLRKAQASEIEAIIQSAFDRLLVIVKSSDSNRRRQEIDSAEVVILILDLARPVLGEQIFKAATNRVSVTAALAAEAVGEA